MTYTPITKTGPNAGYTYQPSGEVYADGADIMNDTMFIALDEYWNVLQIR